MILATFNYNDKEYIYSVVDNKIEYGYKTIDGICKDITNEERELMNQLYTKLVISEDKNNHKKCGIVNYNGKKFQIMYDKISQRKFFYEIIGNTYKIPDYEDFLYLDDKLNPEYVCEENNKIEDINYIKKRKKTICLFGILTVVNLLNGYYYGTYSNTTNNNLSKPYINTSNLNEYTNLTIEDLKLSLDENPYLTSKEKQFILSNFDILEENIDYIDMAMIDDRLKSLMIIYSELPCEENLNGYTVQGRYTSDNIIEIYSCTSFEEAMDMYPSTMSHELYHVFTAKFQSLGYKTYEAMNEIFNREYNTLNLYNGNYNLEIKAVYLLIELLGAETLREYYLKNNPEILINSLTNILDNEEKAYELLGMIDNLAIEYLEQKNKCQNEYEESLLIANLYVPINNLINEYFTVKYGYDMSEDEIMQNYIYIQAPNVFERPKAIDEYVQMNEGKIKGIVNISYDVILPYFSSELINNKYLDGIPKQAVIISSSDGQFEDVTLYFENRRDNINKTK